MEYMFVPTSSETQRKYDIEIINSKIRSHAARISFHRRIKENAALDNFETTTSLRLREKYDNPDRGQECRSVKQYNGLRWLSYQPRRQQLIPVQTDIENEVKDQESMLKRYFPVMHGQRYLSKGQYDEKRRRDIVPLVVHHEIVFYGLLSLAIAVKDLLRYGGFPFTRERALCERKVAQLLRLAVQSGNVPMGLLLWAISMQTNLNYLRCEYAQAEYHANAMRALVASSSREKPKDREGWFPWTVVAFQEYDNARKSVLEMERKDPSIWGPMCYPNHPFPSELCIKLSTLPPGLTSLGLKRALCIPVINAIALVSARMNLNSSSPQSRNFYTENRVTAAICFRVVRTFPLSVSEKILLLTIFSYCYFRGSDPATWQGIDGFVQVSCLRLTALPLPDTDERTMLWEALLLRAAFGFDTPAREYADLMLRKVKKRDPTIFEKRYEIVEDYFWDRKLWDILEGSSLPS